MPDEVWERNRGSPICTERFLDEFLCMKRGVRIIKRKYINANARKLTPLSLMRFSSSRMNLSPCPPLLTRILSAHCISPPSFAQPPLGINKKGELTFLLGISTPFIVGVVAGLEDGGDAISLTLVQNGFGAGIDGA